MPDPVTGNWQAGPAWLALAGRQSWQERVLLAARPFVRSMAERHANTVLLIAWTGAHLLVCDRHLHEDSIALQPVGRVSDRLRPPPWGWLFANHQRLVAEATNQTNNLPDLSDLPDIEEIMRQKALLASRGRVCRIQSDRRRLAASIGDAQGQAVAALAIGGTDHSLPNAIFEHVGADLVPLPGSCLADIVWIGNWGDEDKPNSLLTTRRSEPSTTTRKRPARGRDTVWHGTARSCLAACMAHKLHRLTRLPTLRSFQHDTKSTTKSTKSTKSTKGIKGWNSMLCQTGLLAARLKFIDYSARASVSPSMTRG